MTSVPVDAQTVKESPGRAGALRWVIYGDYLEGECSRNPQTLRSYPKAQIRQVADRVSAPARAGTCHLCADAYDANDLTGSMEYEAVVVKLSSSEALRVLHEFERFNPLTHRRGNTRMVGRGRPYSATLLGVDLRNAPHVLAPWFQVIFGQAVSRERLTCSVRLTIAPLTEAQRSPSTTSAATPSICWPSSNE
jgi:hypothetical protein